MMPMRGNYFELAVPTPVRSEQIKVEAKRLRPLPDGDVAQFGMPGINPPLRRPPAALLGNDGEWILARPLVQVRNPAKISGDV
jgi:hypothetical protein